MAITKSLVIVLCVLWTTVFFCSPTIAQSQLSNNPYRKVFVETDDIDTSYLTQLERLLAHTNMDTTYFSILNDLAYFTHTRNLSKAYAFTQKGLYLTRQAKDSLWYGRFQVTLGAILLRQEKLDSAYKVLQQAKSILHENDLPFLYTQLGYVYERRGQLDDAADYALKSLELGEKLGDKKAIAMAYSDLSNLFWKRGKFNKGLEYGLKSLEIFEARAINDLDYDFTLYLVGNNYLSLNKPSEALNYYERAINIGEQYGFYNNLSDIYISLTDLYTSLSRYQEAEIAGKNAIKYASLLRNNNFMLMRSWLSVGKLQNKQSHFREAVLSLEKCLSIATDAFGDDYFLSLAYEALAKAYAGIKQYSKAYHAQVKFAKLKDAVFTKEADQRISKLQTEFEVAQKDNTIQLQEAQLQQEKTRQILITIIAAFLLVILGLLYRSHQLNRKKNQLLEKQNKEKEFLLKEIHHRVKNNLGVVSGLLALQSEKIEDPNVKDAMMESQNRVNSMSLIHQRLYQGENLANIDMKDYFMNLSAHVLDSFGAKNRITIKCNMDTVEFDIDNAVPLGLIVNELLTNALKYAFPNNKEGKIIITLKAQNTNTYQLEVADNGIGQSGNNVQGSGFGTQLINLLAVQLGGKLESDFIDGTKVVLTFSIEPSNS